jgi:hypothetical protein
MGVCPFDEPIGVIDVHSSVLGATLAPITLPENNTGTDIAEWRPL